MKLRAIESAGYSVKYLTELDYVNFIETHASLEEVRTFLEQTMELD